jgi:Mor family transcriptional regulator
MTDSEKIYLKAIGKNIASLRRRYGFSQLDICDIIDM